MSDFKESGFMFFLGTIVVVFIISESMFFLVRAWKRGRQIGITTQDLKNTVLSSAMFTLTPALSIVATIIALSAALGLVLPWIRLTVIGNISYETAAASGAIEAFGSGGLASEITDINIFSTIIWVMTLGSILPLVIIPIFLKRIQKSVGKAMSKDTKWADVMSAAAFIGLISAFIGRAILGQGDVANQPEVLTDGAGILSVSTLISSVVVMLLLQRLADKKNIKWLQSFAMPMSMFAAMGVAVLLSQVLPSEIAFLEWRG